MRNYLEYFISFILSPILFINLLTLYIYRYCIGWILSKKYGQNFGGFFKGNDSRMAKTYRCENIINILYLVDPKTNDNTQLVEMIREAVKSAFECKHFKKITCTMKQEYGYYFLLENQHSFQKAVNTFCVGSDKDTIELSQIRHYLSQLSNKKMIVNPNSLFEILISEKPLVNSQTFAVIVRIHHALADGPAILHFISYMFESDTFKKETNLFRETAIFSFPEKVIEVLKDLFYLTFGIYKIMKMSLKTGEINLFHNGELSGERVVQWISEEQVNLIPKIKAIRKKTGASFTDVIQTVITASFYQFAMKRNRKLGNMNIVRTLLLSRVDSSQIPKLENNFAVNIVNVSLTDNLKKLLNETVTNDRLAKQTILIPAIRSISKILYPAIPTYFVKLFMGRSVPMAITNMGQLHKTTLLGFDLKHFTFFIPNINLVGIMIGVNCYDGRLTINATVDRKYIDNVTELNEILQASFNNIEQLYYEIILSS